MQCDYLGNPVSGGEAKTLLAIDAFIEGFLAYERRAEKILEAAESDPSSALANLYAGMLWMLLEAPEAPVKARRFLEVAMRHRTSLTEREGLNLKVLEAWVADDLGAALKLGDELTDRYPRDLAAAKLQQYFEFNRGNAPAMLRVALKAAAAAPEVPYVHGMRAFAMEQCHLLEEAEEAARLALRLKAKEPWAQHALAHVLLTRGQIDDGAIFLERASSSWVDLNSFMLTHLWWHLALFYLSQGRERKVLEAYDEHCWGISKDYSQDQIGAVSLLARLEIAGIDVGERWQDVAQHLSARSGDTVQPFLTLQYLYGLARAGRPQADELLSFVRVYAGKAPAFTRAVWTEVAVPACEGVLAHARGDFETAWQRLSATVPRMNEVGGSHAQRDLFEQLLLDAALKSGRLVEAQLKMEARRRIEPGSVPLNTALTMVYGKLGLPALAKAARERADLERRRHVGQ
jgi:hypothetical protein